MHLSGTAQGTGLNQMAPVHLVLAVLPLQSHSGFLEVSWFWFCSIVVAKHVVGSSSIALS
jgi:hypothetical protein